MKSGFNIVIGGTNFQPGTFDYGERNPPDNIVHKGDRRFKGQINDNSFVEWFCDSDEIQDLDIVFEAIDFLTAHRHQFKQIASLPGVEYRNLNIWLNSSKPQVVSLSPGQMTFLAGMEMTLDITTGRAPLKLKA